jgi:hypothetical protein
MGGVLSPVSGDETPRFIVSAMKDPDGASLERVQIIKAWRDSEGGLNEKIYDIATTENVSGEAEVLAYWRDPDFQKEHHAVYYVRVIEVPTKRWTTYDAKKYDVALPSNIPKMTQERAYSSPIWYRPR